MLGSCRRYRIHERHHVVEEAVGLARIDQGQDVGVLELRREANFTQEPISAQDGSELGTQHLERDRAVVLPVAGEIDRRHPAVAELALDRVAVGERCFEV